MSAVDEYREAASSPHLPAIATTIKGYADAAIAELEADVESLKCCGNCEHLSYTMPSPLCDGDFMGFVEPTWDYTVCLEDNCHVAPSGWAKRGEA